MRLGADTDAIAALSCAVTPMVSEALLFAAFGSVAPVTTLAVFVCVPAVSPLAVMRIVSDMPLARSSSAQVIWRCAFGPLQGAPSARPLIALTNRRPAGSVSVTVVLIDVFG